MNNLDLNSYIKEKRMINKDIVNKAIEGFPDEFSVDDLIDKLILLSKIRKGMQDSEEGKVYSSEEVRERRNRWAAKHE